MRRRLLLPVLALVLGSLAASSCLSPTLPLPPPDVEAIHASSTPGAWEVAGSCVPGARVTVVNDVTGRGAVVEDRANVGSFRVTIEGAECDVAWVRQETISDDGIEMSGSTSFVLAPYDGSVPVDNPACH